MEQTRGFLEILIPHDLVFETAASTLPTTATAGDQQVTIAVVVSVHECDPVAVSTVCEGQQIRAICESAVLIQEQCRQDSMVADHEVIVTVVVDIANSVTKRRAVARKSATGRPIAEYHRCFTRLAGLVHRGLRGTGRCAKHRHTDQ